MTVRVYRSTDAGAPILTGQVGSLLGILDACLVNGFGSLASSGWAKLSLAANIAAYKQPVTGSNGFYIRVDDTAVQAARVVGHETITDVSTATRPFPTAALQPGGGYVYKSATSDATARPWLLVCNGPMFYMVISQAASDPNWYSSFAWGFGDITSYRAADAYGTILIAAATMGGTLSQFSITLTNAAMVTGIPGHWLCRPFTGIGSMSTTAGKVTDSAKGNGGTLGNGGMAYPSPIDGGLYVAPVWIVEPSAAALRGVLPGIWNPLHNRPLSLGDKWTPTGDLAGKTLEAVNCTTSAQFFIETSNTW